MSRRKTETPAARVALGIAVAALLFAMPVYAQDQKPAQTLDAGAISCEAWSAAKPASARASYLSWVLDYIALQEREPDRDYYGGQIDLTHGLSTDDLTGWIDTYCAAHPRDSLQQTAFALVNYLDARFVGGQGAGVRAQQ